MAMLFLARYRAEKYRDLGKDKGQTPILRPDGELRTDDQQSAREGAKKLFGWEYVKPYPTPPGYTPGTGEAEPLQGEPSGEVDMHCAHAFLYSKANPNQLGIAPYNHPKPNAGILGQLHVANNLCAIGHPGSVGYARRNLVQCIQSHEVSCNCLSVGRFGIVRKQYDQHPRLR